MVHNKNLRRRTAAYLLSLSNAAQLEMVILENMALINVYAGDGVDGGTFQKPRYGLRKRWKKKSGWFGFGYWVRE